MTLSMVYHEVQKYFYLHMAKKKLDKLAKAEKPSIFYNIAAYAICVNLSFLTVKYSMVKL